jgi:hypothetical protein
MCLLLMFLSCGVYLMVLDVCGRVTYMNLSSMRFKFYIESVGMCVLPYLDVHTNMYYYGCMFDDHELSYVSNDAIFKLKK